jgi:hypothetical protein
MVWFTAYFRVSFTKLFSAHYIFYKVKDFDSLAMCVYIYRYIYTVFVRVISAPAYFARPNF